MEKKEFVELLLVRSPHASNLSYRQQTVEGGGVSEGIKVLRWTKIAKLTNIQVGLSHQWTETWIFGGNKKSKKE